MLLRTTLVQRFPQYQILTPIVTVFGCGEGLEVFVSSTSISPLMTSWKGLQEAVWSPLPWEATGFTFLFVLVIQLLPYGKSPIKCQTLSSVFGIIKI